MTRPAKARRLAAEAIGFAVGALLGYGLALLLGFDLLQSGLHELNAIAVAVVGLGGGLGLGAGRRWAQGQAAEPLQE